MVQFFYTGGHDVVPSALAQVITPPIWNELNSAISSADMTGHGIACLIEWSVCLLTGVWCVFCAHPCMSTGIGRSKLRRNLNSMNARHFGGLPVFGLSDDGSVFINTDCLGVAPPMAPAQLVQQVYYVPDGTAMKPPVGGIYPHPPPQQPQVQGAYYTGGGGYPQQMYMPSSTGGPVQPGLQYAQVYANQNHGTSAAPLPTVYAQAVPVQPQRTTANQF